MLPGHLPVARPDRLLQKNLLITLFYISPDMQALRRIIISWPRLLETAIRINHQYERRTALALCDSRSEKVHSQHGGDVELRH
jgi:hypothetical protein